MKKQGTSLTFWWTDDSQCDHFGWFQLYPKCTDHFGFVLSYAKIDGKKNAFNYNHFCNSWTVVQFFSRTGSPESNDFTKILRGQAFPRKTFLPNARAKNDPSPNVLTLQSPFSRYNQIGCNMLQHINIGNWNPNILIETTLKKLTDHRSLYTKLATKKSPFGLASNFTHFPCN